MFSLTFNEIWINSLFRIRNKFNLVLVTIHSRKVFGCLSCVIVRVRVVFRKTVVGKQYSHLLESREQQQSF